MWEGNARAEFLLQNSPNLANEAAEATAPLDFKRERVKARLIRVAYT